jgi:dolichol-phosphate mannosyltransferase
MTRKTVSLVIPLYNEMTVLPELFRRVDALIRDHHAYLWEVICVNDGSTDDSSEYLDRLAQTHEWLTVLHLSRNFGHQMAISAGIDYATGDAVIVMDGDLQDPPEVIPEMLKLWESGHDVVYAHRRQREGESFFKKFTAAAYYRFLRSLTDVDIPLDTGDFRLMSRPVAQAVAGMREKNRFIRGMVSWVGFRQTPLYYERDARYEGNTKFTLLKMVRFALDGLLSFSKVPLQWITTLGFLISLASFIVILVVLYLKLCTRVYIEPGWPSIMVGMSMLGGIQLICLGMIGEYVGRIFDEVRGRPLYLIRKVDAGAKQLHAGLQKED